MTKIIGLANSCKDCPSRHYYSGGEYECLKVKGSRLNADSSIPEWCPLTDYRASASIADTAKPVIDKSIADTAAWMTEDGERVITDATKRTMPRAVQEPYTVALVKSLESIADTAGAKPTAWRWRLNAEINKPWGPGPWVYIDGADQPKFDSIYDVEPVYAAPAAPSVADAAGASEGQATRTPFSNCRFRECDLPGQCRSEGECHHPATESAEIAALRERIAGMEKDAPVTVKAIDLISQAIYAGKTNEAYKRLDDIRAVLIAKEKQQ